MASQVHFRAGVFCLITLIGSFSVEATTSAPGLSFSPRWSLELADYATLNRIVSGSGRYVVYSGMAMAGSMGGINVGISEDGYTWLNKQMPGLNLMPGAMGNYSVGFGGGDTWLLFYHSYMFPNSSPRIFRSQDGADSWTELIDVSFSEPFSGSPSQALVCVQNTWLFTSGSAVWASEDGGSTWTNRFSDSLTLMGEANGILFAQKNWNSLWYSSDLGFNWIQANLPSGISNSIQDVDYGNGVYVAVTSSGGVITSADNGANWTLRVAEPTTSPGIPGMPPAGPTTSLNDVTYGEGVFLLSNGKTSVNGIEWTLPSRWITRSGPGSAAMPAPSATFAHGPAGFIGVTTMAPESGGIYQATCGPTPSWATANLGEVKTVVGASFTHTFSAPGATHYAISVHPPGVSFNPATGTLLGSPTEISSRYLVVYAVNQFGGSDPALVRFVAENPSGTPAQPLSLASRWLGSNSLSMLGMGTYSRAAAGTAGYLILPGSGPGMAGSYSAKQSSNGLSWNSFSIPSATPGSSSPSHFAAEGNGNWLMAGYDWNGNLRLFRASTTNVSNWEPVLGQLPSGGGGGLALHGLLFADGKWILYGSRSDPSGYHQSLWITDDEGQTWSNKTPVLNGEAVGTIHAAAYGSGKLVVADNLGRTMATSDWGENWIPVSLPGNPSFVGMAYGNQRFVLVASAGSVWSSMDGAETWIQQIPSHPPVPWHGENWLSSITFGDGLFVLSDGRCSLDGINWTTASKWIPRVGWAGVIVSGGSATVSLAHGPEGFIAVNSSGAPPPSNNSDMVYQSVSSNVPVWNPSLPQAEKIKWGVPYTRTFQATGAAFYQGLNLPTWLSLDESTGILSGTPINTSGMPDSPAGWEVIHTIILYAHNSSGTSDVLSFTLTVSPDITPPAITLNGLNPMFCSLGSVFTDPGATVTDDLDPARVVYGEGFVDGNTLGTYTRIYQATDYWGNQATPVARTVYVVTEVPNNPPEIWNDLSGSIQEGGAGQRYLGAVKVSDYEDPPADSPVPPPATTVVTIEGPDAASFAWGASQLSDMHYVRTHFYSHQGLYLGQPADFETQTSYVATIKAVDKDGLVAELPVSVLVLNDSSPADDSDTDMLPDDWEVQWFGSLSAQTGSGDADADGLTNSSEYSYGTNPNLADSDGDGFTDGDEVAAGKDPLDDTSRMRRIFYVNANAAGNNNGTSWENAFTQLQSALDAVGQPDDEVWVAQGTYLPAAYIDPNVTTEPRSKTHLILKGMKVYGGFAGNETLLTQRNPATHPTILSGDFAGNDTSIWPSTDGTRSENAYHVMTLFSSIPGHLVVLDGFTITGGNADNFDYLQPDNGSPIPAGSRVHCDASAILLAEIEADIINCRIEKNSAYRDAVILISATRTTGESPLTILADSVICDNVSTSIFGNGGALMVHDYPEVRMFNCLLERNRAAKGGALHIYASEEPNQAAPKVTVMDCAFRANAAVVSPDTDGDGSLNYGTGGAIYANGEGIHLYIGGTVFEENFVDPLGLLDPTLNILSGYGGAIFAVVGAEVKIVNSVFTGNHCHTSGGAVGVANWPGTSDTVASVSLYHCTFTKNWSRWGGAVDNYLGQLNGHGNIFYDNWSIDGNGYVSDVNNGISTTHGPSTSSLAYSLTSFGPFPGNTGGGVVAGNPRFVDVGNPHGPDGVYGTEDDGVRIREGSPAVSVADADLPPDFADLDDDGDQLEPVPWDFAGQSFGAQPYHAGAYQTLAPAIPDTEPPILTLLGANPMIVYQGSMFIDPEAVARDDRDSIRFVSGVPNVDTSVLGDQILTYQTQDAAGNSSTPVTRTVNVVLDPAGDGDGDGLSNGEEIALGTDPYGRDTDGDGVNDPVEIADGTDPKNPASFNSFNQGLVVHYPFRGNLLDASGNANHLTNGTSGIILTNGPTAGDKKSLLFSGAMDSIRSVNNSGLEGNQSHSFSFWFRVPQIPRWSNNEGLIVTIGDNGPAGPGRVSQIFLDDENNDGANPSRARLVFQGGYSDLEALNLDPVLIQNWHHVAVVFSGSVSSSKIYLNGQQLSGTPWRGGNATDTRFLVDSPVVLGRDLLGVGMKAAPGGQVADVRVYNRAISPAEVTQLYQQITPSLTLEEWLRSISLSLEMMEKYVFGGAIGPDAESEPISLSKDGSSLTLSVIVRTNDTNVLVWGEGATELTGFSSPSTRQTISGSAATNQAGVPLGCQRQEFKMDVDGLQRGFLRVRANISN